jgi:hypothetical protein
MWVIGLMEREGKDNNLRCRYKLMIKKVPSLRERLEI